MNTITLPPSKVIIPNGLFYGSSERTKYLWKNLIIEKRISTSLLSRIFKGTVLGAFWVVLSSSVE